MKEEQKRHDPLSHHSWNIPLEQTIQQPLNEGLKRRPLGTHNVEAIAALLSIDVVALQVRQGYYLEGRRQGELELEGGGWRSFPPTTYVVDVEEEEDAGEDHAHDEENRLPEYHLHQ